MHWKITCYNGNTWEAPYQMSLTEAVSRFCKKMNEVEINIKSVINLH